MDNENNAESLLTADTVLTDGNIASRNDTTCTEEEEEGQEHPVSVPPEMEELITGNHHDDPNPILAQPTGEFEEEDEDEDLDAMLANLGA